MKLHLGCGKRYIPGYIHVDIARYSHIDYQQCVYPLDNFEDKTVEVIYASHVIEYFDDVEVLDVLKDWARVLKPGGCIRLAVPDFDALIEVYKDSGNLNHIIGPIFGRMEINKENFIYHRTVYNYQKLETLLNSCGFSDVSRYDWRSVEHADIDDHSQAYYPHMDKDNGLLVSLNVEAKKV